MMLIKKIALSLCLLLCLGFVTQPAAAQERLCDTSFEDCRNPLWDLIDHELIGIDVALWFIQDTSIANKIIARYNAGVRVLVDPRANPTYSGNEAILNQLKNAGIPMRYKLRDGILHWKMMLFEGQNKLEFSGANYGPFFFVPNVPFQDYIDEAIYFTDDPVVVNSFKTKYDDLWTDTVNYANYGNITGPLTRVYPTFPIDPALNFPPSADGSEDFYNRTATHINQENQKIDIVMYRHTNDRFTARTVEARERGVPVRMLTEQDEYRNRARQWDSYNIDLLYNAGVQIRLRNHQGLNHEKVVLLYGQGMTIFGSSNWTGPSSNSQQEHNYFTTKTWFFDWFVDHFERKWNSNETKPFVPLPPDAPSLLSPSSGATGQPTTNMVLSWEGGPWAHKFDIYFGTTPNPPLLATDQFVGRVDDGVVERYTLTQALTPGTTYYWRIVSKTMANVTATGPVWSFTTSGVPSPTPTVSGVSPNTGPTAGGTSVTITGTNFQTGATVRVGGVAATSVNVASGTQITAVTPAHAAGAVDVVVTNPDTQAATLTNSFTYVAPPPPPPGTEVVLYAAEATVKVGNWQVISDATAAGGARLHNNDFGAAKRSTALANPTDYFEMTFNAQANTPYHLWIRGKGQADFWGNDSVFIQFSGSVTSSQVATYRIGTTSATEMNLEDCSGCGIQGWGWQDNGWGVGVMGPAIYFQTSGPQTLRIQVREDGLSIDQIVLSPTTYLNSSPGALKNDSTILPRSGGGSNPPPIVSSVTPNSGPTAGGTSVTISGSGLQPGAGVVMGGAAATNVSVTSATQITATTPAHAAGAVNVVVTNPDGQAGTLTNGFTYTAPPPPPAPIPQFSRVFLVVEENHSFENVIGSPAMSYLNSLASRYGLATSYYANTQPSIGNYFMLTTGQIITNDSNFSGTVSVDNIVRQLTAAGKSWKSYAESLPSVGYTGDNAYPYVKRHNPFAYLTDVLDSPAQLNRLVPFSQFAADLANNQLPNYSYIIPNQQNNAHDCPAGMPSCSDADKLAAADNWLRNNIAPLLASAVFQQNGLLIITFDESIDSDTQNGGGHVATLVISSRSRPGFQSTTLYQHQSALRLLYQALGLNNPPAAASTAPDMTEFFDLSTTPTPAVSSVSPNTGPVAGGTAITITGSGFTTGATVIVGGAAATNVNVVGNSSINAVTPAHAAGAVDVTVTNTNGRGGTLAGGFTYTLPGGETVLLADDFNDNSLDGAKWVAGNLYSGFTDSSVAAVERNQRFEIGPMLQGVGGSHYNGIRSASLYNFTGAYCYVQLVQPGAANTTADAMFTLGNSVDNYYRIFVEGGSLIFQERINGVKGTLATLAFDSANHKYWRIRHNSAGGTVVFETAPDNAGVPGTWTQRFSKQWSTSVNLSAIQFELKGGTWQVEANAPGTAIFDNFRAARP